MEEESHINSTRQLWEEKSCRLPLKSKLSIKSVKVYMLKSLVKSLLILQLKINPLLCILSDMGN